MVFFVQCSSDGAIEAISRQWRVLATVCLDGIMHTWLGVEANEEDQDALRAVPGVEQVYPERTGAFFYGSVGSMASEDALRELFEWGGRVARKLNLTPEKLEAIVKEVRERLHGCS